MTQAHASPPLPPHPIRSDHTVRRAVGAAAAGAAAPASSSSSSGNGRVFVFGVAGFGGFEVSEVTEALATIADDACLGHDSLHAGGDGGGPCVDLGADGGAFGVADEFGGVLDALLGGFDVEVLWVGEGGEVVSE